MGLRSQLRGNEKRTVTFWMKKEKKFMFVKRSVSDTVDGRRAIKHGSNVRRVVGSENLVKVDLRRRFLASSIIGLWRTERSLKLGLRTLLEVM
jgi:hypothetical protein